MPRLAAADSARRAGEPRDLSEALARGLSVLLAFDAGHAAMTLADVARRTGLPRATARRALLTLVHLGFAEAEGRLFRLTPQVLRLAGAYLGASAASTVLQPACDRLCAELGETCSVAILDGEDAVMIAYASPRRLHAAGAGPGLRLPAFCSAVGRVLLAHLPEAEQEAVLARLRPEPVTPFTVTAKPALRRILAEVRAAGFCLADQEAELGFRSIAVPLRRPDGRVVAALNTGCAAAQASLEAMHRHFLPRLLAEAAALRGQLL
ncbi:IclR family transcriptional regulator domain-containing protein [Paracraurococcus lichenis]|uniref:IclR family transcriptional regulator C-terminal domain-containing protein n=1 Tax=Paracraurococcus lichenis TaxID=3064888 RepID=A0ABT9E655_9PROT|nr:IclR family transcriptional regulator C-terminal domain-containing protein [Paracraurococcus sp. LOR1-02]MDO9711614.1 IclR family transcriptional regulator C-terminal domain-containing protein [Paracraurococcus sp. LOR1-02]